MAKGIHNIVDFSGGINKVTDARDIAENEAVDLDGFLNLSPGKLTVSGGFVRPDLMDKSVAGFSSEYFDEGVGNLYYVNPSYGFKTCNKATVSVSSSVGTITSVSSHPHGLSVGTTILVYKQATGTDWVGNYFLVKSVTSGTVFTVEGATGLTGGDLEIYYAINAIYNPNASDAHRIASTKQNINGRFLFKAQDKSKFGFYNLTDAKSFYGNAVSSGSGNATRSSVYSGSFTGKDPWYHDLNYLWNYKQDNIGHSDIENVLVRNVFYDNGVLRFMPEAPETWDYDRCIRPIGLYYIEDRVNFYNDILHGYKINSGWYALRSHCFSPEDYKHITTNSKDAFNKVGGTLGVDTDATSISTFEGSTSAISQNHKIHITLGHAANAKTGDWQFASGAEHEKIGLGISFIYDDIDNGQESRVSLLTHDGLSTGNNYVTMSADSGANNQALYMYWKIFRGRCFKSAETEEVYSTSSAEEVAIDDIRGSGVNDGFANFDAWNPRIVGANVWITYMDNAPIEDPLYLSTINFSSDKDKHGISKSHDELESSEWSIATGDNGCSDQWIEGIVSVPVITYRMKNGIKHDDNSFLWYKTSAIVNRRLYTGNVSYFNNSNPQLFEEKEKIIHKPDRIVKSGVNRFDILSPKNFLEIMSDDGQDIVKLENYGQELLVFKNDDLFVIDCSAEYEFIKDTKYNYGVINPLHVIKANKYVFWLNKSGVYGYDGEQYYNFLKDKISIRDWKNRIYGVNSKLMFDSKENLLLIMSKYNNDDFTADSDGKELIIIDVESGSIFYKSTIQNSGASFFSQGVNVENDIYLSGSSQSGDFITCYQVQGTHPKYSFGSFPVLFNTQTIASDGYVYPPGIPNVDCAYIFIYRDGTGWVRMNDESIGIQNVSNLPTTLSTSWETDTPDWQWRIYAEEVLDRFNTPQFNTDYTNSGQYYSISRSWNFSYESIVADPTYDLTQITVPSYARFTATDHPGATAIAFSRDTTFSASQGNLSFLNYQTLIGGTSQVNLKYRLTLDRQASTQSNIPINIHMWDSAVGSGYGYTFTYLTGNSSNYEGTYTDETDGTASSAVRNDRLVANIREYLSNMGNFSMQEKIFLQTHITYPITAVGGTSGSKFFNLDCTDTAIPGKFSITADASTGNAYGSNLKPQFGSSLLTWKSETPVDIDGNFYFVNQKVLYESKEYTFFTPKATETSVEDSGPNVKKKIYKMYITYLGGNNNIDVYYKVNRAAAWTKATVKDASVYQGNNVITSRLSNATTLTRQEITFGSDARSSYSFAFKLESAGGVSRFEVHDISLVYRNKRVK